MADTIPIPVEAVYLRAEKLKDTAPLVEYFKNNTAEQKAEIDSHIVEGDSYSAEGKLKSNPEFGLELKIESKHDTNGSSGWYELEMIIKKGNQEIKLFPSLEGLITNNSCYTPEMLEKSIEIYRRCRGENKPLEEEPQGEQQQGLKKYTVIRL